MSRRRGVAGPLLAAALLAGCGGGGGDAHPAWSERCRQAGERIAALPATGPRARVGLAADAAAVNLRDLARELAALDAPGDAAAAANLRNAVAATAVGFADVAAGLRATGTGGQDLVRRDVAAAYARIDAAATTLGLLECSGARLGRARFDAYARADRGGGAAEPLPGVLRQACARLREAYGPTATPVDRGAALTQLRRSRDALADIRGELSGRTQARAVTLAVALTAAARTLTAAERRVQAGADPARTTLAAFAAAGPLLRTAFARAGAPCSALG